LKEKNQETTTSYETCCHFLHLKEKPRNDDKPLCLLSYATIEKKKQKDDDEPSGSSSSAIDEKRNKEMTMSHEACCHLLHLRK
jgi:hypothetical protein